MASQSSTAVMDQEARRRALVKSQRVSSARGEHAGGQWQAVQPRSNRIQKEGCARSGKPIQVQSAYGFTGS